MRLFLLSVVLAIVGWFAILQDGSASALSQRTLDVFEKRPIRTVFIVGNSRTYYNDMPGTLRALANSAESPIELEVETAASPAASFESHMGEPRTLRLLGKGWDTIILQPESSSQDNPEQAPSFHTYGMRLAKLSKVRNGLPTLLVNWPYDPEIYGNEGYDRSAHLRYLHEVNDRLATDANLDELNLAGAWESIRLANPGLKMTLDGNHPTPVGSYLYALTVYRHATGLPVGNLSYVPKGVDPGTAEMLRKAVDSYGYF